MCPRRRWLPPPAIAIVVALGIAAPAAQAANCPGADLLPSVVTVTTVKAATLCVLNDERAGRGIAPLGSDAVLERAAKAYSATMIRQGFFAHVSPAGQQLEQRLAPYVSGAQTWDIGENLAWGEESLATPRAIVGGWMRSATHRANILNASFSEIGIGIVNGSPAGSDYLRSATYTTEFGTRPGATAASSAQSGAARHVSAAVVRRITSQCARIARRTRSSPAARRARAARCVSKRLRVAAGRRR